MKTFFILIIIVVVGYFGWQKIQTQPDPATPAATVTEETPTIDDGATPTPTTTVSSAGKQVDNSKVTIGFTGFGPGKKHVGSFAVVNSSLALNAQGAISGKIVANVNSLSTDTAKVTEHLKTDDFFDTAKYPTATFVVTKDNTMADLSVCGPADICEAAFLSGNFTIHGVTKAVSFPVTRSADQLAATFTLDLKEFGIDQTFANETVELRVTVPIK
jgi:polyisoprenoid-binding protein YceI